MQEALIAVAILVVAVIMGCFIKPTEAQLRPLSPDQIKGPGVADAPHGGDSGHHH